MGDKITVNNVTNPLGSSFITELNNDLAALANEFDKVIYKDGSEEMLNALNMNSNRILNLPAPAANSDPIRLQDLRDMLPTPSGSTDYLLRLDLAAVSGASLVKTSALGTSAITRNLQDKLREFVSVADFGALGDGSNNDAAAFTAAFTSLGAAGGFISIPNNMRCAISSNLIVPPNCHIVGPHTYAGSPKDNTSAPYGSVGGSLLIDSTVTISLKGGATIAGVLMYRKGMTFPAPNGLAFAGVAVTAAGDDVGIFHCQALGFNTAFKSDGFARPTIDHLWQDCVQGVEISNCLDIPYINEVHGWPFATIAAGGAVSNHTRGAANVYLHDTVDWGKVSNCFSWGHFRNVYLHNVNSTTVFNCGGDQPNNPTPQFANSIGVYVDGNSLDTRIFAQQAAANETCGVYINTAAGCHTIIHGLNVWGKSTHGVLVDGGDASITGSHFRDVAYGVTVNNAASSVFIDHNRFTDISASPLRANVTVTKVVIGSNNDFGNFTGTDIVAGPGIIASPVIVSSSAIAIPRNGSSFVVTGTTGIGTIVGGYAGRVIFVTIRDGLTFFRSTGPTNAIETKTLANVAVAAGTTVTLVHTGDTWRLI